MAKENAIILEIRAGTGGGEAALFVADLFKMYSGWASRKNFTLNVLSKTPTSIGGFKEIIFEIKGENVSNLLSREGGVHRVQRIPKTEKGGRIHTSTATIAVLQKVIAEDINIDPRDIRVDTFRSSGPGGQYVNKRETAIRITHLPTGITAESQNERSQQSNRESAMSTLRLRVAQKLKKEQLTQEQEKRKSQIGGAERAEKIRTYNFPQNRLTDHRIKKSWRNLENIMSGNLDLVIKTIQEKISAQGGSASG